MKITRQIHAQGLVVIVNLPMSKLMAVLSCPPGKNVGDIDWFVRQIDVILHRHTGKYISRAKPQMNYVAAIFAVADPEINEGAMEAAVKRRIEYREISTKSSGELASENSSNCPQIADDGKAKPWVI